MHNVRRKDYSTLFHTYSVSNHLYEEVIKFTSGILKQSCPLPNTADACFLLDIHLKYVSLTVPRVFYRKQGLILCIHCVRHLTLLENNYLILQKPLSLR